MDIRPVLEADIPAVIELWTACDLVRPWNDPDADMRRALEHPEAEVFGGFETGQLIATAMAGYDGHRGWLYYVAVSPDRQCESLGAQIVRHAEDWLKSRGAPKVMLMVRHGNEAAAFYEQLGYERSEVASYGKFFD